MECGFTLEYIQSDLVLWKLLTAKKARESNHVTRFIVIMIQRAMVNLKKEN